MYGGGEGGQKGRLKQFLILIVFSTLKEIRMLLIIYIFDKAGPKKF